MKRPSASEMLSHPWFKLDNKESMVLNGQVLERLHTFHVSSVLSQIKCKLKQAIMTFILTQIEKGDEMKELLRIFRDLDTDHDGTLTKEELIIGLQRIKPKETPQTIEAEVANILVYIDSNLSGRIDFTEFALATLERDKLLSSDNLLNCFKMFDKVRPS